MSERLEWGKKKWIPVIGAGVAAAVLPFACRSVDPPVSMPPGYEYSSLDVGLSDGETQIAYDEIARANLIDEGR